ncbi:MerR family transcriptional regulator [Streptomyces sp. NPDC047000]|uniref:MerR family transcriptional regulator n=1 Tax=Streptomyces sp. NPDC047000 TaxID=3155474 RepID=UPI0033DEA31A
MRVREIAELTGTTVRTIRYYHEIGLLPVPEVRHGYRDYRLVHLARLIRIRWLVDSGLPLGRVGQVLAGDAGRPRRQHPGTTGETGEAGEAARSAALADLRGALTTLEDRLRDLSDRHERLVRLVASVESGGAPTPMPATVARFYDDLEARAPDEATAGAVRQERDFIELAYFRGDVPPEAELLYIGVTEESLRAGLDAFRTGVTAEGLSDEEIERFAAGVVARMKERVGGDLAEVIASLDTDAVRRLYELYDVTADERARRVGRVVHRLLTEELEKAAEPGEAGEPGGTAEPGRPAESVRLQEPEEGRER